MSGQAIPVAMACDLVLSAVTPLAAESIPIDECLGRVSAGDVRAEAPVPGFDNSAMDGFAVRSADLGGDAVRLRIVGESRAGHPAPVEPQAGEVVRISTGAVVPPGADAVVPLEEALEQGESVLIEVGVDPGKHVRRAGEDLAAGAVAVAGGSLLGAAEIAVLASIGKAAVSCSRRPRVAVLSGGDELLAPGEAPVPGAIYDANRFGLVAMAREAGSEAYFAGAMADTPAATREAIRSALDADFVVVTGGVSVGRHDHVKGALAELGVEQLFWRVALRPGGPTWAGVAPEFEGRRTLVFGLPGNPVSALVTFRLFVQPALRAATGLDPRETIVTARLAEPFTKAVKRAQYLRCRLEPTATGWLASLTTERQGSHVLTSMLGADGLAVIPAERDSVAAGEEVEVLFL